MREKVVKTDCTNIISLKQLYAIRFNFEK